MQPSELSSKFNDEKIINSMITGFSFWFSISVFLLSHSFHFVPQQSHHIDSFLQSLTTHKIGIWNSNCISVNTFLSLVCLLYKWCNLKMLVDNKVGVCFVWYLCLILNGENKKVTLPFLFCFFAVLLPVCSVTDSREPRHSALYCLADKAAFERCWFYSFDTGHFYTMC